VFLSELRAAVGDLGASTLHINRQTGSLDTSETMHSPAISTGGSSVSPNSQIAFDSMAGTVSSSALGAEEQAQIASARAEFEREQQQRDQIARDELDREAEARRQAAEEKERKRKEAEEQKRKEEEERAERERQAREQMERVERQAKELEERLSRLATSMPPGATVAESASALGVNAASNSLSEVASSFPGVSQSLPGASVPPKGKSMLVIGGIVLAVLLLAGGGAAYFLTRPKPTPPVVGQTNPPTNPPKQGGSIKADLVAIPGGSFQMGRNDGPPQERPEHSVTVPAFFMDRTEVTNAEYAEFVRDMGYEVPSHWVRGQPLPGQEQWPVVNVSPKDAEAFAAWRSKRDGVTYRLPTEEEWEFAARSGGEFKSYPWGDTWQDRRAVVKEATPQPVGTYPDGKNKWGVVDLIGNAWEWTSSKASLYNNAAEIPSASKEWVVARGGSYASDPKDRQIPVSATYRDWFPPTTRHQNFGFRLVRSA
jgi:formylglycine-generating enzyme required for sulfatase activity